MNKRLLKPLLIAAFYLKVQIPNVIIKPVICLIVAVEKMFGLWYEKHC